MRVSLFVLASLIAGCKKSAPPVDPLDQPLGWAPGITRGTLSNGVQWFAIDGGESTVRLVVRAGSADETADQQGAAAGVAAATSAAPEVGEWGTMLTVTGTDLPVALEKLRDAVCCAAPPDPAAAGYHHTWYAGSNVAVVVTGETADVEAEVKRALGGLASGDVPVRTVPDAPTGTVYDVSVDPGLASAHVRLLSPRPLPGGDTVRWQRERLLEQVGLSILRARLERRSRDVDAPFASASAAVLPAMPGMGVNVLEADGDALEAYAGLLAEGRRLATWGVLNSEIRVAEKAVVDAARAAAPEGPEALAEAVEALVVRGFPVPGSARVAVLAETHVPSFTVAELTDWAHGFLAGGTEVEIVAPTEIPEAAIHEVEARVGAMRLEPPVDQGTLTTLAEPPAPGSIAKRSPVGETGFERWELSNGAVVLVRDMPGPVAFRAVREGGLDGFSDETWRAAALAPAVREASGLGEHDPASITRFLAARDARANASIDAQRAMLSGGSSPEDVGIALQQLHLLMAAPRFTEEGLEAARSRVTADRLERLDDPMEAFEAAWSEALFNDPRRIPIDEQALEAVALGDVEQAWKALFSDPSDFRFVVAGDVPDDFDTLVSRWLASIPSADTGVERKQRKPTRDDEASVSIELRAGLEARAFVRIESGGVLPDGSAATRERARAVAGVLETLLREDLVESAGGLYGVRASVALESWPRPHYVVRAQLTSHPALVDEHAAHAHEAFERFVAAPLDAFYVEKYVEAETKRRDASSSVYWVSAMVDALEWGDDPAAIGDWPKHLAAITPQSLHTDAKAWLRSDYLATGVLKPGEGAVEAPPPLAVGRP